VLLEVTDSGWVLRDQVADVPAGLFRSLDFRTSDAAQLRRLLNDLLEQLEADGSTR
jgi:hypothetical protein